MEGCRWYDSVHEGHRENLDEAIVHVKVMSAKGEKTHNDIGAESINPTGTNDRHADSTTKAQSTTKAVSEVTESPRNKEPGGKKPPYVVVTIRLLITVALVLSIFGVLKGYETKDALTRGEKYTFNTLMILFTTALGLNMTITYTKTVQLIREGLLYKPSPDGQEKWPFRQRPKFEKIGTLRHTLGFLKRELFENDDATGRASGVTVASSFILLYLLFNIGVAIAIALLGLTYSLEDGGIGRHQGIVGVVDTKHFYRNRIEREQAGEAVLERNIANSFADASLFETDKPSQSDSSISNSFDIEDFEDGWRYNFHESNLQDSSLSVLSNRFVKTSANCTTRRIQSYNDTTSTLSYYGESDEVQEFNVVVARTSTTYLSPLDRDGTSLVPCGNPRCGWLVVAEFKELEDYESARLYECWSTVGQMSPATLPEHNIPDNIAIIAATSLAHSGLGTQGPWVLSFYGQGFGWGERAEGNAEKMAKMISKASAGVFAMMDQANPRLGVPGMEPWRGVLLKVRWPRVIALLVLLGVLQMVIALPSIYVHKKYYPKCTSEGTNENNKPNFPSAGV
ncbi:hypothetical protein BDZ91DRAFT_379956 [Kalaharituber pfeilii]|nr:hypothetical protein BDZ91DRAFT_379956 [Kalaharituber pfeilii]